MFRKTIVMLLLAFLWGFDIFAEDFRFADKNAGHTDWITYGQGHENQRYSTLRQITESNVAKLRPAWIFQTGILGTFPTNPLVVDGVMYISTPFNHVFAIDALTGVKIWHYAHEISQKKLCCGSHNRGVAWGHGRLFMITADARLVALDGSTGRLIWDIPMVDPMTGDSSDLDLIKTYTKNTKKNFDSMTKFAGNMAPVVHDGKVFVGVSGTGYSANLATAEGSDENLELLGKPGVRPGLRAFVSAYDVETGSLEWRWYVTASSGWEGDYSTTNNFGDIYDRDVALEKELAARNNEGWRRGGGSIYGSPSIDHELGLLYIGTGNPAPTYSDQERPGDNLYTSSLVALDINTGKLRWHYQIVPHDIWGYDVAAPPVLFSMTRTSGKQVKAVSVVSKSGWLYVFNRATGELLKRSQPFVPQSSNMFARPTLQGVEIAPGAAGGANWPPSAYSRVTKWMYVVASHRPTIYRLERSAEGKLLNVLDFAPHLPNSGRVAAIDPVSGKIKWSKKTDLPLISGALTTETGLLFHGQSNGDFVARSAHDGSRLWKFHTGAGVNAPPITYSIGDKQFVAVASGGHALFGYAKGNAVVSFSLPD
jgi:PQQ-dependent dehydrogenase (methanol/ethanol family)